jgi:hypothetical protein
LVDPAAGQGKTVRARNHAPERRVARFMASRTSHAWDATTDGRSSVASELDAIFAPLPPPAAPVADPVQLAAPTAARGRGIRSWLVFLIAVALAALVGSLAFLMPVARQAPPRYTPQPRAAMPATPPAPLIPSEPAPTPAPAVAPKAPSQPRTATPSVRHEASSPPRHARCSRFATQAWCLRGSIRAADNELRNAYDAAIRAGVARRTLVDIRSDWKRLRGRANRDPQALIRGYALLTQELRAEIRRRR